MRVLITNNTLGTRAGSESFVRDLARALGRLGHSVLAYSSDPHQRERLLENDVIPVATDLENLPVLPDVIHGQHHLDTMTALLALPRVPALFHCRGTAWPARVVRHPRIYRYLAMSQDLAERMMAESSLAATDIAVFSAAVDLERFSKVRKLPARPARALLINGGRREDVDTIAAIRGSSRRCGLELDIAGQDFDQIKGRPEKLLPEYDIVFASGQSAIEALACGCAVVIPGRVSCGDMVTPENFERLRQVNFSNAGNSSPLPELESELRRFSAEACARVSGRLRSEADFGRSVGDLVQIYEQVVERHRQAEADMPAEILATSKYLREIVPLIKKTDDELARNWESESRSGSLDELNARISAFEEDLKKPG